MHEVLGKPLTCELLHDCCCLSAELSDRDVLLVHAIVCLKRPELCSISSRCFPLKEVMIDFGPLDECEL